MNYDSSKRAGYAPIQVLEKEKENVVTLERIIDTKKKGYEIIIH